MFPWHPAILSRSTAQLTKHDILLLLLPSALFRPDSPSQGEGGRKGAKSEAEKSSFPQTHPSLLPLQLSPRDIVCEAVWIPCAEGGLSPPQNSRLLETYVMGRLSIGLILSWQIGSGGNFDIIFGNIPRVKIGQLRLSTLILLLNQTEEIYTTT